MDEEDTARKVSGAVADGESQVVIQISDLCDNISENDIKITIPGSDGALGKKEFKDGVFTQIWKAPENFVREGQNADLKTGKRKLDFQITIKGEEVSTPDFYLFKPPVVLVHGIWANAGSLKSMMDYLGDHYSELVYSFGYPNSLHFADNVATVGGRISGTINTMKNQKIEGLENPIIVKKADVVAHSMGGLWYWDCTLDRSTWYFEGANAEPEDDSLYKSLNIEAGLFGSKKSSDFVVSLKSQKGGSSAYDTIEVEDHATETDDPEVQEKVAELLNSSIDKFDKNGFSPPTDYPVPKVGVVTIDQKTNSQSTYSARTLKEEETSTSKLIITSPEEGKVFSPGDTVTVEVTYDGQPKNGICFLSQDGSLGVDDSAPYEFQFQIDEEFIGSMLIVVWAETEKGGIEEDSVEISIETKDKPESISITPSGPLYIERGSEVMLYVEGTYPDGITRDITSHAAGTSYISADSSIASITEDGVITAVSVGETTITVQNGVSAEYKVYVLLTPVAVTPTPVASPTPTPKPSPTPTATNTPWAVPVISAEVSIRPKTINLKSKGKFKAFIKLPSSYDVDDIVPDTVTCEGASAIDGKTDNNDRFVAAFNVRDLDLGVTIKIHKGHYANKKVKVKLTVAGELKDGTKFEGSDTVTIKGKGNKHNTDMQ